MFLLCVNEASRLDAKILLCVLHNRYDVDFENIEYVKNDALVAERLTSSPRIYDIYGMCGLGIMSEFFPHGGKQKNHADDDAGL